MLLHEEGEFVEESGALGAWGVQTPCGLEGFVCGFVGEVDVLLRGFRDLGDDGPVRCSPESAGYK